MAARKTIERPPNRHEDVWDAYAKGGPQCRAYFCSRRCWKEDAEFCNAHEWEGVWYTEAYYEES